MIQLTRLNSERFALNTDLIERIEANPDTVVTLIDGTKYLVSEALDDVIERIVRFRARVVTVADSRDDAVGLHLVDQGATDTGDTPGDT